MRNVAEERAGGAEPQFRLARGLKGRRMHRPYREGRVLG